MQIRFRRCILLVFLAALANAAPVAERLFLDTGGHRGKIKQLMFSSGGSHLVSLGADQTIRIWRVDTGESVDTIHLTDETGNDASIDVIAISPDDKYIAVASRKTIYLLRSPAWRVESRLSVPKGRRNEVGLTSLAFSRKNAATGKLYLVGGFPGDLYVWDTSAASEPSSYRDQKEDVPRPSTAAIFSPRGDYVVFTKEAASSTGGAALVYLDGSEFRKGSTRVLSGGHDRIVLVTYAESGDYFASASPGMARIFNYGGQEVGRIKTIGSPLALSFAVATGEDLDRLTIITQEAVSTYRRGTWRKGAEERLHDTPANITAAAISANGQFVATGTELGGIQIRDSGTWSLVQDLHSAKPPASRIAFLSGAPGLGFGLGWIWDPTGRNCLGPIEADVQLLTTNGFNPRVTPTDETANGCGAENTKYLPNKVDISAKPPGTAVKWLPDGYMTLARDPGDAFDHGMDWVYNQARRIIVKPHYRYAENEVPTEVSHDDRFWVRGQKDGIIEVRSVADASGACAFRVHDGRVLGISISVDDRWILSTGEDQTIALTLNPGTNCKGIVVEPQLRMYFWKKGSGDYEWLLWTRDNYYDCSTCDKEILKVLLPRSGDRSLILPIETRRERYQSRTIVESLLQNPELPFDQAVAKATLAAPELGKAVTVVDNLNSKPPVDIVVVQPDVDKAAFTTPSPTLGLRFAIVSQLSELKSAEVVSYSGNGAVLHSEPIQVRRETGAQSLGLALPLSFGVNHVTINARNVAGGTGEVDFTVVRPSGKKTLLGLAIAPGQYEANQLAHTYSDAQSFSDLMAKADHEYLFEPASTTKVLPYSPDEPVDRASIVKALDDWAAAGDSSTVKVLYLAGHGRADRNGTVYFMASEHDFRRPVATDGVPLSVILEALTRKGGPAILIGDFCTGGKIGPRADWRPVFEEVEHYVAPLFVLLPDGTQSDTGDLMKALVTAAGASKERTEAAEADADGFITAGSWMKRVKELSERSGMQVELFSPALRTTGYDIPLFYLGER